jgi:transcriptional regulator of met regulon
MKVYHQTGHNLKWNIDSYKEGVGNGLIFSPINIDADKLLRDTEIEIKKVSFLDPQLYLLNQAKGSLETYPFFPENLRSDFSTPDLDNDNLILAELCINYQLQNDFKYLVIPTKYNVENPTNYLIQCTDYFVLPFCEFAKQKQANKKILLSVIIKGIMLTDDDKRNEVLNWITGHQNVDGVYLIFENNFASKQIKDFDYLLNALRLIKVLKDNLMEVHIGYCNTEALLYSIAMPDSVTIGSYENLRSFGIRRFQETENGPMRSPNARLYSSKLLQWVDYGYIQPMKTLVENYSGYFDESAYNPLTNFEPDYNWQFKKTEPYKHYFYVFDKQIKELQENQTDRIVGLKSTIKNAISLFNKIENDVLLDENNDGSHLPTWFNVINAFQKELNK